MTGINYTFDEVLRVVNQKGIAEVGGGHDQKGVNFQRHWAVLRMFELEDGGADDFLLLFEAIQDVAEFDSCISPTSITIYQVKKKDRNEWSWNEITGLKKLPSNNSRRQASGPTADSISRHQDSMFSKLYKSVIAFSDLSSEGCFVSNAGCDLPLANGQNAATSLSCDFGCLDQQYIDLLAECNNRINGADSPPIDLSRIRVSRVDLPVNDPSTYLRDIRRMQT